MKVSSATCVLSSSVAIVPLWLVFIFHGQNKNNQVQSFMEHKLSLCNYFDHLENIYFLNHKQFYSIKPVLIWKLSCHYRYSFSDRNLMCTVRHVCFLLNWINNSEFCLSVSVSKQRTASIWENKLCIVFSFMFVFSTTFSSSFLCDLLNSYRNSCFISLGQKYWIESLQSSCFYFLQTVYSG